MKSVKDSSTKSSAALLRFYKIVSVSVYIALTGFFLDIVEMYFDRTNTVIYEHNLQHFWFKTVRGAPFVERLAVLFASVLTCMLNPIILLVLRALFIHFLSCFFQIRVVSFKERRAIWAMVTSFLFFYVVLNGVGIIDTYSQNPYTMHICIYLLYGFCGVFL